jgi:hypothetical protein
LVSAAAFGGAVTGWSCALGGVLGLRLAWRRPGAKPWLPLAWVTLCIGALAWRARAGADLALALALLVPSLVAYAVLAASAKIRRGKAQRPPRAEVELVGAAPLPWRAVLRALYAGPLSALAALGCGTAVALRAPLGGADRLIAGGLLTPVAWAGAMIWSTTEPRLARVGVGLAATAILAFAVAAL